jgi:hypothetical protein
MSDWLQPAIVAAVIAALMTLVGLFLNRSTVKSLHHQRLDTDVKLAEKRSAAEIDLAKQRFVFDRKLAAWRRRVELAEEVLADFYKAREIIAEARAQFVYSNDGTTRPKFPDETADEAKDLNDYYAPIQRLEKESEFFALMSARRYRFIALFGMDAATAYDEVTSVRAEIIRAVQKLILTHRKERSAKLLSKMEAWEDTIGWGSGADPIKDRLDQAIERIQEKCRPVIQESAEL